MNYKEAIESVRQGNKVSRKAWLEPNGAVMGGKTKALMLVSGAEAPYRGIGRITIEPFISQYVVGGHVCAYQPTQGDIFAKDWQTVEVQDG